MFEAILQELHSVRFLFLRFSKCSWFSGKVCIPPTYPPNTPYPYISQVVQSLVWWWLMYGATCPCWTTGIWCPGWQWLAADTTAWYTTENSTPSEDWACQGTWTMWRGKSHLKSTAACLQTINISSSSQLVSAQLELGFDSHLRTRVRRILQK